MAEIQQFIQSIEYKGKPVDLGHLLESTYIERTDIAAPLLILKFNDVDAIIREEYGVKNQDEIKVSFGDPLGRDAIYEDERFTVQSMPMASGHVLTVNCIQSDAFKLLPKAGSARFFVGEPAISVIRKLFSGAPLKFQSSDSAAIEDYHLLPQQRPIELIRQIARETGKLAFLSRGVVTLKSFDELLQEGLKKPFDYHYRDSRKDSQIIEYRVLDSQWKAQDILNRNYAAADMVKGKVDSKAQLPTQYTGVSHKQTLAVLGKMPIPAIEFLVEGHGGLQPGKVCKITWNKLQAESPVDESLPDTVVIGSVSHYSRANRYQCRVMGLVVG